MLFTCPSYVVFTKEIKPELVCFGMEARDAAENEFYVRLKPVAEGQIVNETGARLLIKACMQRVFGKTRRMEVCVLVSCALKADERRDIERLFVEAGYGAAFVLDSAEGLIPHFVKDDIKMGIIIGDAFTEVALSNGGKIGRASAVTLGGGTLTSAFKETLKDKYSLIVTDIEAEKLKKNIASLAVGDTTRGYISGMDKITGAIREISVSAKDFFPQCDAVYSKIAAFLIGFWTTLDKHDAEKTDKNGIIVCGRATKIAGFSEYFERMTGIRFILDEKPQTTHLSGAYELVNNSEWLMGHLEKK